MSEDWRIGDHRVISDLSGRKIWASESRKQWNGMVVHESEYEPRHPLDTIRARRENPGVQNARPEPPDTFIGPLTTTVEGLRTNLILQSADFTTTWATDDATISANAIVSPDGTATADKLVETATTAIHRVRQDATLVSGSVYTWSVYLKAAERTWALLNTFDGVGEQNVWINLATGGLGTVAAGSTAIVRNMGNGWYRLEVSRITAGAGCYLVVHPTTGDLVSSYAGDITKGIYVWGAQLELGGAASSYIPTTTSAVTVALEAGTTVAVAGATSIEVASTAGMSAADRISIMLEEGTFRTTIQTVTDSTHLALANALPSSLSVGKMVVNNSAITAPTLP